MKITKQELRLLLENEERYYLPQDLDRKIQDTVIIRQNSTTSFVGDHDVVGDGKNISPDFVKEGDWEYGDGMGRDSYWVGLLKHPIAVFRKKTPRQAPPGWYLMRYGPMDSDVIGGPYESHQEAKSAGLKYKVPKR